MNIDTQALQKSAIVCWRHLLRTLDGLPASKTVGFEHVAPSFVAEGVNTRDGFASILAFLALDIPADIETRQEIFCANINDMIALNVFDGIPEEAIGKTKDAAVAQEILDEEKYIDGLKKIQDEEDDWMMDDVYFEDISNRQKEIENLKQREFCITVHYNIYLQWLCSKISDISAQQCFELNEAAQFLTHLQTVGIENLSQRLENNRQNNTYQPSMHKKNHEY